MSRKGKLHLAATPRAIPLRVRFAVLFGGTLAQLGWIFFGFGMCFVWAFGLVSLAQGLTKPGLDRVATGTVLESKASGAEVNEETIYEIRFAYEVDGRRLEQSSYSTEPMAAGRAVSIELSSAMPEHARIHGTEQTVFPWWVPLVCAIFPLVGLGFITTTLKNGRRGLRLLRHGQLAFGKLASKEETNVRINDMPVYRLLYNFQAADYRTYTAEARSHTPEALEDEDEEPILYLPDDPRVARPLDEWSSAVEIGPQGGIEARGALTGIPSLIIPAASVLLHGGITLGLFVG